jgi:hypothetical protein
MPRAICEVCSHFQPVDWQPGDLCTECGQAVRREVRCFWCAKWTPAGKFCRRCGAAVLEESLYGAARMLRDAGTDRFRIPKLIVELDPDQVDNFTRIYQRHAAVMHRHVDHVRFLETFLHQHLWSDRLEEELIVELPWPEERLERLTAAMGPEVRTTAGPPKRAEDLETARAIHSATPFADTRCLAAIVRLLLDDWSAQRDTSNMLSPGNEPLRTEAALALAGWRVLNGIGILEHYRELLQTLRDSPLRVPAAVRRAMLKDCEVPPEAMVSEDPEIRFMAALANGTRDTLVAALRSEDELRRFAAARRLIELDVFSSLGEVIRQASPDGQLRLLRAIAKRTKPAPDLREIVYEVAAATAEREIRQAAVAVLCCGCPAEEVERLAEAAQGDSSACQTILQRAGLPPESLARLGCYFLRKGVFRAGQYGMNDIARKGRMPADFVPRHWDLADDQGRKELCGFAECQLLEYADEGLHRFLVGVAFGTGSVPVRATVWTALYRWYRRLDPSGKSPISIQTESIQRFFGSVPEFLTVYTRFLKDPSLPDLLRETVLGDPVFGLLRYPDPDVLPAFASQPAAVSGLADAIVGMAQDRARFGFNLRTECIRFLGWLATVPEFRTNMRARIVAFQGSDLDHACNTALERL